MWPGFKLPSLDDWVKELAPVLKKLADDLGEGPFFAGKNPGYGEAFIWHNLDNQMIGPAKAKIEEAVGEEAVKKLMAFHAKFEVLPGIKEYLAGRPKKFGVPGSYASTIGSEGKKTGEGISCCTVSPGSYQDLSPEGGAPLGSKLIKMTLKVGEQDEPHDHPKHYMYIISGGKLAITGAPFPAGVTKELEMKTGSGMIVPAGAHQVKNVGDTDVEILFLEVSDKKGMTPEAHKTPQETDPGHYNTLAEDGEWMVVKMDMKVGEEDHPHSHRDHIVYMLDGGEITIWPGKEKGEQKLVVPITPGMVVPVPTGFHIVANTGDKPISAVYFESQSDNGIDEA